MPDPSTSLPSKVAPTEGVSRSVVESPQDLATIGDPIEARQALMVGHYSHRIEALNRSLDNPNGVSRNERREIVASLSAVSSDAAIFANTSRKGASDEIRISTSALQLQLAQSWIRLGEIDRATASIKGARDHLADIHSKTAMQLTVEASILDAHVILSATPNAQTPDKLRKLREQTVATTDRELVSTPLSHLSRTKLERRIGELYRLEANSYGQITFNATEAKRTWGELEQRRPDIYRSLRSRAASEPAAPTFGARLSAASKNLLAAFSSPGSDNYLTGLIIGGGAAVTATVLSGGTALIPITLAAIGGTFVGTSVSTTVRKWDWIRDGFRSGISANNNPTTLALEGASIAMFALPVASSLTRANSFVFRTSRVAALNQGAMFLSNGVGFRVLSAADLAPDLAHLAGREVVELSPNAVRSFASNLGPSAALNNSIGPSSARFGEALMQNLSTGNRFLTRVEFNNLYKLAHAQTVSSITTKIGATVGGTQLGASGGMFASSWLQNNNSTRTEEQRSKHNVELAKSGALTLGFVAASHGMGMIAQNQARAGLTSIRLPNPERADETRFIARAGAEGVPDVVAREVYGGIGRDQVTGLFPGTHEVDAFRRATSLVNLTRKPMFLAELGLENLSMLNTGGHEVGNAGLRGALGQTAANVSELAPGSFAFRRPGSRASIFGDAPPSLAGEIITRAVAPFTEKVTNFGLDRMPAARIGEQPGLRTVAASTSLNSQSDFAATMRHLGDNLNRAGSKAVAHKRDPQLPSADVLHQFAENIKQTNPERGSESPLRMSFQRGIYSLDPHEQRVLDLQALLKRSGHAVDIKAAARILGSLDEMRDPLTGIYNGTVRTPWIEAVQAIQRNAGPDAPVAYLAFVDLRNLKNIDQYGRASGYGAKELGNKAIEIYVANSTALFRTAPDGSEISLHIRPGGDEFAIGGVIYRPSSQSTHAAASAAIRSVSHRLITIDREMQAWAKSTPVIIDGNPGFLSDIPHSKGPDHQRGTGIKHGFQLINPALTPTQIFLGAEKDLKARFPK